MKLLLLPACALMAFHFTALGQGVPLKPADIKLGKIQPAVIKTPEYTLSIGPEKRSKSADWLEVEVDFETKPDDISELTFKYTVLFEGKLLDGEVTYVNIVKGRQHFAVVYVSPKSIEKLTVGKPMSAASIQNVWLEVSSSGQLLAKESYKPGPMPGLPHTAGHVLNKDETPFAPLFYDRYEAIKKSR